MTPLYYSIYTISNESNDLKICHVGHFSETEVQVPSMPEFAPVELNPVGKLLIVDALRARSGTGQLFVFTFLPPLR